MGLDVSLVKFDKDHFDKLRDVNNVLDYVDKHEMVVLFSK